MGPVIVFLICTWALKPLLAAKRVPPDCVFPFKYKGVTYAACTTDGTRNQELWWCSLSSTYEWHREWRPCEFKEYGEKEEECVFPFIYKGNTYYTCTNENDRRQRYWCATTENYDKHKKFSYCADTRLHERLFTGSCKFPFTFQGKTYNACTRDGRSDGKLWCSLSTNFDQAPLWTYCEPSKVGGITEAWPCWFPFTYMGQTHNTCITEDDTGIRNGKPWCSVVPDQDVLQYWTYCTQTNMTSAVPVPVPTQDETSRRSCYFPFRYSGFFYDNCKFEDGQSWLYWCSLTSNYDVNREWKYCEPSDMLKL